MPPVLINGIDLSDRNAVARLIHNFCVGILDATADVVPAVKPQVAFFERLGPPGFEALEQIVAAAKQRDLLVISDEVASSNNPNEGKSWQDAARNSALALGDQLNDAISR